MSDPSLGSLDWLGVQLRVREPESDEPAGALILNHGRGADHNDLYGLLDELDPSGGCSTRAAAARRDDRRALHPSRFRTPAAATVA